MTRHLPSSVLLAFVFATLCARAAPAPVIVWFRSSEGCPDGEAFGARLRDLEQPVQLAQAGDHVDFVVTLHYESGASFGRLERQTQTGIVALREYRDARCEDVAEALALTLGLALEPNAETPAAPSVPALASASPAPPVSEAPAPPPAAQDVAREPARVTTAVPRVTPTWILGGEATVLTGAAPTPAWGAGLFAAVDDRNAWLRHVRATLFGARAEGRTQPTEINVSIFGARLEGCPVLWEGGGLALAPCAAVDLGALHAAVQADGGASDTGFWAAASVLGRARAGLGSGLALEARAGLAAPLVRYGMGPRDGSEVWFRTEVVGFQAGLGVAWQMP